MRTDRAVALLLGLLVAAGDVRGEIRVDAATQVSRIRFTFDGDHPLSERELRDVIVLQQPGRWDGVRGALKWLWIVPEPEPRLFSPLELQRDVVRLRRVHAENGYPRAAVRYELDRDEKRNRIEIRFVVAAGPPLVVSEVSVADADSLSALPVPPDEQRSWDQFVRSLDQMRGRPAVAADVSRAQRQAQSWWQDRGHPFALAAAGLDADSARSEARLVLRIAPGPTARVGTVRIEGADALRQDAIARELPFRTGDAFSAKDLTEGQRQVAGLEPVRLALVDMAPGQAQDSVVDVRVRVTEADPRLISGEVGYVSDGGVASEVRWTHRNLNHRALGLTLSVVAQTGWLALVEDPDKRYRGSVTLQQPFFIDRRVSLLFTPYVEHRDDRQDRSVQYGVDFTTLAQAAPLRTIALKYGISQSHVIQYRFGDFTSGDIDLLSIIQDLVVLNQLGSVLDHSTFTLSSTVGALDDPALPRRGLVFRPEIAVTTPKGWNSTEYFRVDAGLWGYLPLSRRAVVVGRVGAGRLYPFGKSNPGPGENPNITFLQFRDVAFTAGGVVDVRGWENRLMGPKFPDVRADTLGGDTTYVAGDYVPLGGLARASATLELQLPLPGFGPKFGTHFFLDGGRVWTPDERFRRTFDPEQERWFFGTGGGIDFRTPVGPIRFGIGYKLNPSIEDLVDSKLLLDAVLNDVPLETLKQDEGRRFQYYLSIGAAF